MSEHVQEELESKEISKDSKLLYRVFYKFCGKYIRKKDPTYLSHNCFKFNDCDRPRNGATQEMSTDWADKSSLQKTKMGGSRPPEEYAVISLIVRDVENIIHIIDEPLPNHPGIKIDPKSPIKLTVDYSPTKDNYAHTDILRYTLSEDDRLAIQFYLTGKSRWEAQADVPINNS